MSASTATDEPVHVESQSDLESFVGDHDVVLVDYHADWCGPCKMLEPTVEEIAAETDVLVAKVDIDELQSLAQEKGIRSVPTLQFYADGAMAEQVIGVQDKSDLMSVIDGLAN
ncbi:thioredoxin [Haloquadratum walsbyi]|jgi:thioredoxin|uniref:Thioredoxin n=1 Tax=Haloquadratum walsbyi J07HQW2 TaxID=1238425 RepID=U1PLW4_9EURY|nr:thioredoxin [Haloquadratum walsbyi]ERG94702.1 MAG: thioredoxin [Haloquadratum walsbyi J07HQW2]